MAALWQTPRVRRLGEGDAILAQARAELRLGEARCRLLGCAAADDAWLNLVSLFIAGSGDGPSRSPSACDGPVALLERRGLVRRSCADGAPELTGDGTAALRAHFAERLFSTLAMTSPVADDPIG